MDPEMEKAAERTEGIPVAAETGEIETPRTEEKKTAEPKKKKEPSTKKTAAPKKEADGETPEKKKTGKRRSLVLVGAGSFTGRGVKGVKKGMPLEVDDETAEALLDTGLFEEE